MPIRRNMRAIGTPACCEARLKTTLTASRSPQVVSSSAVAFGSAELMVQVSMRLAAHARPGPYLSMGLTHESFAATLALIGLVILVASLLSGAVERTGIPQVAIFLLLGAVLGPAGLKLVELSLGSPALQVIA